MTDKTPVSTHQANINIGGYVLKCHVLDNGERIIETESLEGFFEYLSQPDTALSEQDVMDFGRFMRGIDGNK